VTGVAHIGLALDIVAAIREHGKKVGLAGLTKAKARRRKFLDKLLLRLVVLNIMLRQSPQRAGGQIIVDVWKSIFSSTENLRGRAEASSPER